MLGKARYMKEPKTGLYQKIKYTLNYGEFIFGRLQWSKDLDIGEQKIRTCLKKLINDNMIEIAQKSSKFTIYKIINYEKFNQQDNQQESVENKEIEGSDNQQTNQQITDKQPSINQQVTTNEERKEGCKKVKNIYCVDAKEIYNYWLLKASHINKAKLTDNLEKEIGKALKKYSKEKVIQAIDNYIKVFDSDYYYSATFTLMNFLKQSNCIPRFVTGVDEKYDGDIFKDYISKHPPNMGIEEKPYWANIDS